VRDNMPFGRAGTAEFGTYFIGYCRTPRVIEQMLENMFVLNTHLGFPLYRQQPCWYLKIGS
jgi:deferrochelatase/peroxidase EfeB